MTRLVLVLVLGLAAGCTASSGAPVTPLAGDARVVSLVPLSGPSPFPSSGCGQPENSLYGVLPDEADDGDGVELGEEADVSLVADPNDARHLVAAWSQDAAQGIVAATSFDGGRTWNSAPVPGLSLCSGAEEERHIHTRLAFGPEGRVYVSTEADDGFFGDPRQPVTQRIPVASSPDGGLTWADKIYVDEGGPQEPLKGLSTIAAEPDVPGAALVAWHLGEPQAATGTVLLSRSTDGGQTWTRHVVRSGSADDLPFSRILALRNGDLLMFAADQSVRGYASSQTGAPITPQKPLIVQRSTDKGETWSAPVAIVAEAAGEWPAAAEAPDGTVYASWIGIDGTQALASSADHGASWTVVATGIARPDHSVNPALAVNADGVIGFVYTDHRNAPEGTTTRRDTWLAYSRDRGATWLETHIATHDVLDKDLGLIQQTIGMPGGFAAAFIAGAPLAVDGPVDAFYAEIRVPKAASR